MIGWLDCSAGVSGDMLLGALVDAGVPLHTLQNAVDTVAPEPVRLRAEEVRRAGLRALKVHVDIAASTTRRTWAQIRDLLSGDDEATSLARATFEQLARAEAAVHGVAADDVHFHEVGALDAIADVVGVAAGFAALALSEVHVSPVAVGAGTARSEHGVLPVPAPAVVELLRGAPTYAGRAYAELATPTGATLVATLATAWGQQPPMTVHRQGTGAGSRDLPGTPNVLRLLVGEPTTSTSATRLLEANIDDMDPRLWPGVLVRLLDAGAADAWLVPILMKKGRLAYTLSVLTDAAAVAAVCRVIFTETTTIGLRETVVAKHALDRTEHTVRVDGHPVRVKTATLDGHAVNAQPEFDDVVAAAAALGRPVKTVLAEAAAAAQAAGFTP